METDSCTIRYYCRNKVAWLPGKMKMQHEAVNSTAVALTTTFPCPAITTRVWQTVTCSERLQHCKLNQTQPAFWPQGGKKNYELWILWKQDLNQKLKSVRKKYSPLFALGSSPQRKQDQFFRAAFRLLSLRLLTQLDSYLLTQATESGSKNDHAQRRRRL